MVSIPLELWGDIVEDRGGIWPDPKVVDPPGRDFARLVVESFGWKLLDDALMCPVCAASVDPPCDHGRCSSVPELHGDDPDDELF